ncbi:hypothetical protein J1N35_044809 [Gossypium stocksii]|uniref:Endonuclease/exonuclease/phosphatase domain-containing protein n=1 Tax=Gossypium stocksii TaxID=47602 RepID=A0A9D3UA69_9ROSI|nr:hypothetical protein J1N35_044809 [Gossypium stocksii]
MDDGPSNEERPICFNEKKNRLRPNFLQEVAFQIDSSERHRERSDFYQNKDLLKEYCPHIFFFMETKVDRSRMERLRRKFRYQNGIEVAANGTRGGLSLGWTNEVDIRLLGYNDSCIDVMVTDSYNRLDWHFTGFYGAPDVRDRVGSWNLLRNLSHNFSEAWVVIGDFNEILSNQEKYGGRPREEKQTEAFSDTLDYCGLTDLGYQGRWYTWERGNFESTNIRERLHREVANLQWYKSFSNYKLVHLPNSTSDHCPIFLDLDLSENDKYVVKNRDFRFEKIWLLDESCHDEVKLLWDLNKHLNIPERLHAVSEGLSKWAMRIRRKKDGKLNSLKSRLNFLYNAPPNDETLEEIIEAKLELNLEIDKTEIYWEQRARSNWLKNEDRNTSFFHSLASNRCRMNKIMRIRCADGSFITEEDEMMKMVVNYFKELFTSSWQRDDDNTYEGVFSRISPFMNEQLLREFKVEDFREALWEIEPTKAPGVDGFHAIFFQKFWHIIEQDVAKFCLQVINREISLHEVNSTKIILIPKVRDADTMSLFRPISFVRSYTK